MYLETVRLYLEVRRLRHAVASSIAHKRRRVTSPARRRRPSKASDPTSPRIVRTANAVVSACTDRTCRDGRRDLLHSFCN